MVEKKDEMQVECIYCYKDTDKEEIQLSAGPSYGSNLIISGLVKGACHVTCLIPKEEAIKMAFAILYNYGYTDIEKK